MTDTAPVKAAETEQKQPSTGTRKSSRVSKKPVSLSPPVPKVKPKKTQEGQLYHEKAPASKAKKSTVKKDTAKSAVAKKTTQAKNKTKKSPSAKEGKKTAAAAKKPRAKKAAPKKQKKEEKEDLPTPVVNDSSSDIPDIVVAKPAAVGA
eukprot:CAMPEP_0197734952 /NCGR_PEP_ID=MMETSP1435-20131217/128_1 /TAXON_ID=426625 /ORGANISM="Chaetoceros brevis, Strain CCMP164" /LENGTH=148 /DNA_ID=CAMNT_0043322433 /DNA_START=99 /DNA_END=546 /DNA_ORIENTATION=+